MTMTRWVLLVLIAAAAVFVSPQSRADSGNGWVNDTIGYSPEDVRRFLRYRRIRQERLERLRSHHHHGEDYETRAHHQRHHGYAPTHHGYTPTHCVTDFWGRCIHVARHRHAYRWRYYRHRPHHRHGHHHGHHHVSRERIDHGLQCQARRRVVGEERPSRAKAQRAADNAWMGSVRYDHGERYQDLNHAKDVRHNCDPSSTTTILKRVFFRCVIEATPCRAPLGSGSERVERRYEEETDEDDK